jgi:hypothetical protein
MGVGVVRRRAESVRQLLSFQGHLAVAQWLVNRRKVRGGIGKLLRSQLELLVVGVLFDGGTHVSQGKRSDGLARRLKRMRGAFEQVNVLIIYSSLHSIKEFLPVFQVIAYQIR